MGTHKQVIDSFIKGESLGGYNLTTDGQRLIGYDWAVMAEKLEVDGIKRYVLYFDWYGYSATTSKHYKMIKDRLVASGVKLWNEVADRKKV